MERSDWPNDHSQEPHDDQDNPGQVEFFKIEPRHVPNPAAPDLTEDFADDLVEHPRQFRATRLKLRKRHLTQTLIVSVVAVIFLIAGGIAISRLVANKRADAETPTPTSIIQVTVAPTLPPVKILTILEGQRYNIRTSPDLSGSALKTAVGGDQYTISEITTGEKTDFGDQWYKVELDGQSAYIIADSAGQELSEQQVSFD